MTLFFDIETAYLIDKKKCFKCTAWRKNEVKITHIHIANQQSNDSQMNGFYVDKKIENINTERVELET